MKAEMNSALQARLPGGLRKRAQRLATAINVQPYYGTPPLAEQPSIYRSTAQSGSRSFYAYATCYVICKNKRVTIALIPVRRDDTMVGIITRLLDRSSRCGVRIKRLYNVIFEFFVRGNIDSRLPPCIPFTNQSPNPQSARE